jgi:hypothetical protein|tara:strand:+ start:63 stop:1187 length:1125 start_codon:yes stop_codon:yes gene_type:complete
MFSISNFKVEIDTIDISSMVTSMNLYESVHGNVKGTIHVEDKLNFFDMFFRGIAMTEVKISYIYFDKYLEIDLYADGVTDQVITKMGKSYNVTLSSLLNLSAEVVRICNSYSGSSNEILSSLWKETHGEKTLFLDTECASGGKYVVPNISSSDCMRNVVNAAYDVHKTGMFLYQRLVDQGATRFGSIHTMGLTPYAPDGKPFVVRNEEITLDTTLGIHETLGTANSFTLKDYNKDFITKLAGGMWGQKITEIALDETTNTVHNKKEATDIEITKFSLSKNLYDTEVSLFSPESLVHEEIIMNMKYRLFNTNMHVDGLVAIPSIGCGMTVDISQGGNSVSSTKTDGTYLVANINHMYTMDDGLMNYSQNLGLVRE